MSLALKYFVYVVYYMCNGERNRFELFMQQQYTRSKKFNIRVSLCKG